MIVYTSNQLFDILGSVDCETDLIEIEHYLYSHGQFYSTLDFLLINECITDLYQTFGK